MRPMTDKVLETERMVLRRMEMADVDGLMGIFSDPVAMRYYPGTKSRQEAEEWVRRMQENYRDHGFGLWVAVLEDSGEFAGQCGLTVQQVEGKDEVEIGYLFLRQFWGRGLATEAARAARDHGFNTLGYERLVSPHRSRKPRLPPRRREDRTHEKEIWKWKQGDQRLRATQGKRGDEARSCGVESSRSRSAMRPGEVSTTPGVIETLLPAFPLLAPALQPLLDFGLIATFHRLVVDAVRDLLG